MRPLAALGEFVCDRLAGLGQFVRFALAVVFWLIRGPHGGGRLGLLLPQLYQVGTRSLAVVMVAGAFVGAVVGIEMHGQFASIGMAERVGGAIHLAVFKQIGPVLAGAMIGGRVGGAIAAELGSMRAQDQLDALRVMGIEPVSHLAVPRVIACILMLPLLTVVADMLGMFGGYLVSVKGFGVDATAYWMHSTRAITNWDLLGGVVKGTVFGGAIGLISCYKGFHCKPTAEHVGRATTEAFVVSFLAIIVGNLVLAYLINELYTLFYGDRPTTKGKFRFPYGELYTLFYGDRPTVF
jgi:phospholipid/cholesterol/gamma-HCH transport system permease protein